MLGEHLDDVDPLAVHHQQEFEFAVAYPPDLDASPILVTEVGPRNLLDRLAKPDEIKCLAHLDPLPFLKPHSVDLFSTRRLTGSADTLRLVLHGAPLVVVSILRRGRNSPARNSVPPLPANIPY